MYVLWRNFARKWIGVNVGEKPRKRFTLNTSQVALNGNTATPTIRSDTASDTMNVLVGDRSLELLKTAATTSVLPTVTMSAMNDRPARAPNTGASLHTSESRSVWHSVWFIGDPSRVSGRRRARNQLAADSRRSDNHRRRHRLRHRHGAGGCTGAGASGRGVDRFRRRRNRRKRPRHKMTTTTTESATVAARPA